MNQQKLDKWEKWITRIELEVLWLHHHRRIWRSLDRELESDPNAFFFREHHMQLYVSTSAITVRRLAETGNDDRVRSLGRLLQDLAACRDMVTAEWFGLKFENTVLDVAFGQEQFEKKWGDGTGCLSANMVNIDIQNIKDASVELTALADRTIAHIDNREPGAPVTFHDLDSAVTTLGETFNHYRHLLLGAPLTTLEPCIQGDWKAPFRAPLFTHESDERL